MSLLISLFILFLILASAVFLFTRVSGLLRFFVGLAVFCVAVAFLVPIRRRASLVLPSPFEEVLSYIENAALYGVNVLAGVLRFLGGLFGIS